MKNFVFLPPMSRYEGDHSSERQHALVKSAEVKLHLGAH